MYNLYTYEKQQKEKEDMKTKMIQSIEKNKKRKVQLQQLSDNYKQRVKDFIADMTIPGKEIKLNNNIQITNSRETKMHEQASFKRNFIFKGYKTERERIEESLKNNIFLHDYSSKHSRNYVSSYSTRNINNNPINYNKTTTQSVSRFEGIIQPIMRFKPRTDLERVFDTLNESPLYHSLDKEILQRHLRKLSNSLTVKVKQKNKVEIEENKPDEIADHELKDNDPYHQVYKHYIKNKKEQKQKDDNNIKNLKKISYINNIHRSNAMFHQRFNPERRMILNDEAKEVLSDLHQKTHFKATVEIAEKDMELSHRNYLRKMNVISPTINRDNVIKEIQKDYFKEQKLLEEKDKQFFDDNKKYAKNYNPFTIHEQKPSLDNESKQVLTELIQSSHCENEQDQTNINKYVNINDKVINSKDCVKIHGKEYSKEYQIDVIAKFVLNNCNVYHDKSRYNNTRLKSKNGKLMITNGLTVNDFQKKYKI